MRGIKAGAATARPTVRFGAIADIKVHWVKNII